MTWTDVMAAIGTVGAVVVALGLSAGNAMSRWWVRRRHGPQPGVVGAEVARERVWEGDWVAPEQWEWREAGQAHFVRLLVENGRGRQTAHDVTVSIVRIDYDPNGSGPAFHSGARLNFSGLGWTHVEAEAVNLEPGRTRTVDLGWVGPERKDFRLGAKVEPLSRSHLLPLSQSPYRIIVGVSAKEVDVAYYKVLVVASERELKVVEPPTKIETPTFDATITGVLGA